MGYLSTFSTLGCAGLGLDDILALAARHGLGAVELRALDGTIDLPAALVNRCGAPSALAGRLRHEPVRIVSLDTSFKLVGPTEAERAALLEHVPWAEAVGARLRVFDGGRPDDPAALEAMAATLAWWRRLREHHRWQTELMVETHDALLTARAIQDLLTLAPATDILWDAHHTWRKGGEDPLVTWRAVRPRIVHVHVKDSLPAPELAEGYRYCLPGEGEFPMPALREALRREFDGPVSLEWERLWHPELPPLEEALRTATERNWW